MKSASVSNILAILILANLNVLTATAQSSNPDPDQKLALLSLRFERTDDVPLIEIEKFVVLETKKQVNEKQTPVTEAVYALVLSDSRSAPLDTVYIDDPLNPVYEYSENAETIQSVRLQEDEGHVLIRFPFRANISQIRVAEINEDQEFRFIHAIPVPEGKE